MSLWREEKYLRLVSPQLDHFTQKNHQHTFNFRCPLCGDSETNKSRARGYVYPKGQILLFKCHNCGISLPFSALLKRLSVRLYDEYILEGYRENTPTSPNPSPSTLASPPRVSLESTALASLDVCRAPENALYDVYRFAADRQIPDAAMIRLFATDHARAWLEPLVGKDKAASVKDGLHYFVQALRLPTGEWYGAQLRYINRKEFLTFRWSHDPLKIFGLEALDARQPLYIVEGPIDSLFLPNSLAACGSALQEAFRIAEEAFALHSSWRAYVWDNEPRNKDVCRQMQHAIDMYENVVIWPRSFPKDLNDMACAGIDAQRHIQKYTFSGLFAQLEFKKWKA